MKQSNKSKLSQLLLVIPFIATMACQAVEATSDDDSNNETVEASDVFPTSLAVASPLDYTTASSSVSGSAVIKAATGGSFIPVYQQYTSEISAILSASSAGLCTFDAEKFLEKSSDTECFGPAVAYEQHPDATDPNMDGELPPGDLGIWNETDDLGHACSVGELNSRMNGASSQSQASLMAMASLICTLNANGYSMPSSSSLDLTVEMNALGVTDVTFDNATIAHEINADGDDQYSYAIDLDYAPGGDQYRIVAELVHIPGASDTEYRGRLSFRINDQFVPAGNCPTTDVTQHGSLLYAMSSETDMDIEVRGATACDHDSNILTDGLVDPTQSWGNNFSIFVANFDPSTMTGHYSYSWQAGEQDDNTRIFNIVVEEDNATNTPAGTSFYGYGEDIGDAAFNGEIEGFLCNWAGPSASHSYVDFAQYQEISFDAATGLYQAGASNILYAPTVSCDYDGLGAFTYDSDLDGAVDTDPTVAITHDLLSLTDVDGDLVWDEITDSGFTQPTAPSNI